MRIGNSALFVALAASLSMPVEARKGKKGRGSKAAAASAETVRAVGELMGDFRWGMTKDETMDLVLLKLRGEYEEEIRKASEHMEQQRIRDELARKEKELRDGFVRFEGQKTGWDVSFIDKEFAHKNQESMLYRWEKDQRRFFLFHEGKLYKMVVALSQKLFKDKTWGEFAELMQQRYGKAEPVFSAPDAAGQQFAEGLQWPPAGPTVLKAVDHTGFYGTYILVLYDLREATRVAEGRQVNSPSNEIRTDLVDEVLGGGGDTSTVDDDVVDRVTGRAAEGAQGDGSDEGLTTGSQPSKSTQKDNRPKKKKITASDNPLDGME